MRELVRRLFRENQVTSEITCKHRDEMRQLGQVYLGYLQATRRHRAIHAEYHAKGERTVQQTADQVGFKLPQDHQEDR